MPDMVDYFRERMGDEAPTCEVEFVATDLRDAQARAALFTRAATLGPLLVITEGLLIYLTPDQVGELARDLHEVAQARWWLMDIGTPMLRKYMERTGRLQRLEAGNAPMRFFPEEGTGFFVPFGWRELEFRSTWDESLRLKRTVRGAWLFKWLARLQPERQREAGRRMSGIALLERVGGDRPN